MIALGLGSNLGRRLQNLKLAIAQLCYVPDAPIRNPRISQTYRSSALLKPSAPKNWDREFLNLVIVGESKLSPEELLQTIKEIERNLGRPPHDEKWGPRVIDIDLLAWDGPDISSPELVIPHPELLERPFALLPLAELLPNFLLKEKPLWLHTEKWRRNSIETPPLNTRACPRLSRKTRSPEIMAVLNLTPDSFSDGGKFNSPDTAIQRILELVIEGADIIDIGAESTRPGALTLSQEEEWKRLVPTLDRLTPEIRSKAKFSLDTRYAKTAELAIERGFDWINDVSGMGHSMAQIASRCEIDFVLMHSLSVPANPKLVFDPSEDPVELILSWTRDRLNRLEDLGIDRKRLILDPGIGFGKSAEHSLEMIQRANEFKRLGCRVLFGHSRKSFLNRLTRSPFHQRDIETLAASLHLSRNGIDYLRVHDVSIHRRAFEVDLTLQ